MTKNLYEILTNLGYTPTNPFNNRKNISLCEKGVSYVVCFSPSMECATYRIDGNIIKDISIDKCDYVVISRYNNLYAETYVELKGGDLSHGIDQLKSTIRHYPFVETDHKVRRARLITDNRIPANTGNSIIERAKIDFKKMGCQFKTLKCLQPDYLKESDFDK